MDEDYVLLDRSGTTQSSVCARRAGALRQWGAMRADHDYGRQRVWSFAPFPVCNQADIFVQQLDPIARLVHHGDANRPAVGPCPLARAWQRCQSILKDVPQEVCIHEGRMLGSQCVGMDRNDQRIGLMTAFPTLVDPLLWALVDTVDPNDVLRCLQPNDPVSWHCVRRQSQQR